MELIQHLGVIIILENMVLHLQSTYSQRSRIYIGEQSFPFPKRLYGFKGSFGFSTKLYSVVDVSHSKEILLEAGTETPLKTQWLGGGSFLFLKLLLSQEELLILSH